MKRNKPATKGEQTLQIPLAIIGIGCLFPKAEGLGAYWANIKNRVDGITDIPKTHWDPDNYYDHDLAAKDRTCARRGGFLSPVEFNPIEFAISPRDIEAIDTTQLLGLLIARDALEDAGYGRKREFDRSRTSVILGVTGALELVISLGARLGHPLWRRALKQAGIDEATTEDVVERLGDSYVGWQENSFPGLLGNVVAGRIANQLDLGGTNCVVDAACASSLSALHLASLELTAGRSDMVVTGGLDTFNDIFMYTCFSKTFALSQTGDARPFDQETDGTILGEGIGLVVLKRLEDARRDGDRIYAAIRGLGTSSDGKGNAIYTPSREGQITAMQRAYGLAGVTPDTIDLVEAHGTGTRVGDQIETKALVDVYGSGHSERTWCALGSVKSQIGHTKAAAGVAGLIKAAMALYHKVLPPTIKVTRPFKEVAPGRSPFYVNIENRPWLPRPEHPRRAVVSSFGFGGSNFHCVLEEDESQKPGIDWDNDVQILAFSANSKDVLLAALKQWPLDLTWEEIVSRAVITRSAFDPEHGFRLVLVIEKGGTDPAGSIRHALSRLSGEDEDTPWHTPDGVYFGSQASPGKLGVLFPGQGAQYVGMLRDLACQFPQMQNALTEADTVFSEHGKGNSDWRLSDHIYPHPEFSDNERRQNEETLRDTRVAQPAVGAVSLGLLRILEHFGVAPEAVAGHSFGELVALCVSGRYQTTILHSLSILRGTLMAGDGDRHGSMLAVQATAEDVFRLVEASGLDLVIANKNAPEQTVVSGPTHEIERAAGLLGEKGIRHKRLNVSAAFHSRLVSHALAPFRKALEDVPFSTAGIPVYANSTAKEYPRDRAQAREALASQLVSPVEFVQEIENMYEAGVRTFVEVGPGRTLTGLVASILGGRRHTALAVDASRGKRSGIIDLARVLAHLASLGFAIQLDKWEDAVREPAEIDEKKPAFTVSICGANYFERKPVKPAVRPVGKPVSKTDSTTDRAEKEIPPTGEITIPMNRPRVPEQAACHCQMDRLNSPSELRQSQRNTRPMSQDTPVDAASLAEALRFTQNNMAVLEKFQAETAELHRQFLTGQEKAQQTLQSLIEQQQQLFQAARGVGEPVQGVETVLEPSLDRLEPVAASTPDKAAPVAEGDEKRIEKILLDVVAEKTGYPVEMLSLDMGLDSDLGIDSIKRVEILSALGKELPDVPSVGTEHWGSLQTLGQIVQFLSAGSLSEPSTERTDQQADQIAGPSSDQVSSVLLGVVAEKTGYPVEMLSLDMGLDSDLGIDSIKRVEILSALGKELPDMPSVGTEHWGSLQTLGQIVQFLSGQKDPEESRQIEDVAVQPPTSEETVSEEPESPEDREDTEDTIERHVPMPVRLNDHPAREGITLPGGARIWVAGDGSPLASGIVEELKQRGYRPELIDLEKGARPEPPSRLEGLLILSQEPRVGHDFLKSAFHLLQQAGPVLRQGGRNHGAVFATVSRLDGAFALYALNGKSDPVSGGLAGFSKTARHEWPEVHCKAMDIDADDDNVEQIARAVVDEMFLSGPAEVGISSRGRIGLELCPAPIGPSHGAAPLHPGDVVVMSGGARGVTAEAAVALARAWQPALALLGRSPLPHPEPGWLAGLVGDAAIKRAVLEHADKPMAPREVEGEYRSIMANREIVKNLDRIQAAGSRTVYRSVDVRDQEAVDAVIEEIQGELGPVRGFIHGAGTIADRLIEEKTPEQFELVYSTKVNGLVSLLSALESEDLKFMGLFSSSTGRYGRAGQVDYAVANEVLNKMAQDQARKRPNCRVVAFNWGPWDGGMVTPSLKKIFQNEGVGLIPLEAGAEYLVRELSSNGERPVEVVVLGKGTAVPAEQTGHGWKQESSVSPSYAVALERTLSVDEYPFLSSHVIDGQAVLPMAVIIEWLGHGAMHGSPGLKFRGFNDLEIHSRLVLDGNETVPIRIRAGRARKEESDLLVPVQLCRVDGPKEIVHAQADVVLVTRMEAGTPRFAEPALKPYPQNGRIYSNDLLFHGEDFFSIEDIEGYCDQGMAAWSRSAPSPSDWIKQPLRQNWLSDPLVLDSSFQMMILWSLEAHGVPSLPVSAARYRQFQTTFPQNGARIVVRIGEQSTPRVQADIEFLDRDGQLIARMEGYTSIEDPSLAEAFRRNRLLQDISSQ